MGVADTQLESRERVRRGMRRVVHFQFIFGGGVDGRGGGGEEGREGRGGEGRVGWLSDWLIDCLIGCEIG